MHRMFNGLEAAKAAGMSNVNFRAHLSRRGWRIHSPRDVTPGVFTLNEVLAFALARILNLHGVNSKTAFQVAMDYFTPGPSVGQKIAGNIAPNSLDYTLFAYSHGESAGLSLTAKAISDLDMGIGSALGRQ